MIEKPSKRDAIEGLVARLTGLDAARHLRIPPVNAENLPQVAGLMGSCAATIMVMLRNEAGRNKFQRWIGATPLRQASEETAVRATALAASTSVAVMVAATMEGARRYQKRGARLDHARNICQLIGVAAKGHDGAMTFESKIIFDGAMAGTGLKDSTIRRLQAKSIPADIRDLESYPLDERGRLSVATIAFCAMAAATDPDDAADRLPTLLLYVGLPRPAAEALAEQVMETYHKRETVLTEHYAQMKPSGPESHFQVSLPLAESAVIAELIMAANPNERARQVNRQMLGTLIRDGAAVVLSHRNQLQPAMNLIARSVGKRPAGKDSAARASLVSGDGHPALPEP